jgi:hypothetical protein
MYTSVVGFERRRDGFCLVGAMALWKRSGTKPIGTPQQVHKVLAHSDRNNHNESIRRSAENTVDNGNGRNVVALD